MKKGKQQQNMRKLLKRKENYGKKGWCKDHHSRLKVEVFSKVLIIEREN